MELSSEQKQLEVSIEVKYLYQMNSSLEEALDHWGVDISELQDLEAVKKTLVASINYAPEDIQGVADYVEEEVEVIQIDGEYFS